MSTPDREKMLLDPGFELTLRPMRYPSFYDRYRDAIKNTWTVEEVDLHSDVADLAKLSEGERHLIGRLVAFFATGDSIVSNNVVLSLYKHINSPEARLYLSRQLFEEAVHVQFYLTLLDTYLPDPEDRNAAFAAVENIPSIRQKAQFCFKYMNAVDHIDSLQTKEDRRAFLLNLICFAACVEGLFFYGAFAYVYWFRSRGLLHGLATGTNWVFRDESMHMDFAMSVVDTVREEEPDLFDDEMAKQVTEMLEEAVEAEPPVRPGPVRRRPRRHEHRLHAPVPGGRGRPAPGPPRPADPLRVDEPVRVHGTPERPGADQLLRAPRLRVPGRRRGLRRLRRRLLNPQTHQRCPARLTAARGTSVCTDPTAHPIPLNSPAPTRRSHRAGAVERLSRSGKIRFLTLRPESREHRPRQEPPATGGT